MYTYVESGEGRRGVGYACVWVITVEDHPHTRNIVARAQLFVHVMSIVIVKESKTLQVRQALGAVQKAPRAAPTEERKARPAQTSFSATRSQRYELDYPRSMLHKSISCFQQKINRGILYCTAETPFRLLQWSLVRSRPHISM